MDNGNGLAGWSGAWKKNDGSMWMGLPKKLKGATDNLFIKCNYSKPSKEVIQPHYSLPYVLA